MALIIDKRREVPGPGVHVLIVGVSDYLQLPNHDDPPDEQTWSLNKLTSGALSAFKIYDLIRQVELVRPLKTVRLLLSPSTIEIDAEPDLGAVAAERANRQNFAKDAQDWRDDANDHKDNMTLFYFAGHGIQRGSEDSVLLLDDFLTRGPPALSNCVEVGNIKSGMAPSPDCPNIALTQFYFVDACRMRPETLKKFVNPQVPDVFNEELNVVDHRQAPIFYSTVDGAISVGRAGRPSHFAEALTLALQRGVDERQEVNGRFQWPITFSSIKLVLDTYYKKHNLGNSMYIGGASGRPVIRCLHEAPDIDICVRLVPGSEIDPCGVRLIDENDAAFPPQNPINKTQFEITLKAGFYKVQVDSAHLTSNRYRSALRRVDQGMEWPWTHQLSSYLRPAN